MSWTRSSLLGVWAIFLVQAAAQAAPVDSKSEELQALHSQIEKLRQSISKNEKVKNAQADRLANSERAVSAVQRRLQEIAVQKKQVENEITRLVQESQKIEKDLVTLRLRLGEALYQTYVEGAQAGTRSLLSGQNLNQISRDAYYLEQLARVRANTIEEAKLSLDNLRQVNEQAQQRKQELAELEREARKEALRLERERQSSKVVLSEVSGKLNAQQQQIISLQNDQIRLQKLIEGLEQIAAQQKAAPVKKEEKTASNASSQSTPSASSRETANKTGKDFFSQKGRLAWPVQGVVSNRFGAPRADSGTFWRGLFIKAPQGSNITAVSGGVVAFAEWLRGFGNLLVLDHGNGYMTVYGNNDAVLKKMGEEVKAGEVVALVGNSGGQRETGLYFEIRYRGEPTNPSSWMISK